MCFPIQPGCGRLKDVQPQPETRFCSKCGTKVGRNCGRATAWDDAPTGTRSPTIPLAMTPPQDWARLYESTQRLQFCFMPLWQTGQVKRYFRCGTCGAVSPV